MFISFAWRKTWKQKPKNVVITVHLVHFFAWRLHFKSFVFVLNLQSLKPFYETGLLCVFLLGPRRTVCANGKTKFGVQAPCFLLVFLCVFEPIFTKSDKSNRQKVKLSEDLISIEFLWTFQRNRKTYFKCQLSTEFFFSFHFSFALFLCLYYWSRFFVDVPVTEGIPLCLPLPFYMKGEPTFEYISRIFFPFFPNVRKTESIAPKNSKKQHLINVDATVRYSFSIAVSFSA